MKIVIEFFSLIWSLFSSISFQILDQELLVLLPDQSLTFSSSDHFKYKVLKYVMQSTSKLVVIDGRFVRTIDATVAKVIL